MPARSTISVRIDRARFDRILHGHPKAADDALGALALEGQRIVVTSFNTSPPGRSYRRGSIVHVASQPGYPPNVDIGGLRAAIGVRRPGQLRRSIHTGNVEYAPYLEFGTTRMAARPFMRPMAAKLGDVSVRVFDRFLEKL